MTRFEKRALAASVCGTALLSLGAAPAQAAPVATSTASAPDVVAEIVVTGERREEKLQKLSIAATALTGQQLQARGVVSIDDLQYVSPSITVTNLVQVSNINIRGIGKGDTGIQNVAGVIPYWDGVASFPSLFQDEPYYDIANIEIDRGPQGTFGGSAATGGAVFITTANPDFSGTHGFLQAQGGNYGDYGFQATLNLPVNDKLSLRFASDFESHDSFFKNTPTTFFGTPIGAFSGDPGRLLEGSVRFSALWKPTDSLSVLLKAEYNYIDLGGYPGSNSSSPLNETQPNPRSPFDLINNTKNYDLDRFGRISLDVSYVFPDGITLRSITAYQQGLTIDATDLSLGNEATFLPPATFPYPTEYFVDDGTQSVTSEEVDLVSPSTGALKWVAGVTAEGDVTNIPPGGFNSFFQFGSALVPAIWLNAHAPRSNEAIFGQVTYDLDEHWTIVAGGRYSWSSNTLVDTEYILSPIPVATSNETVSDGHFTGKLAVDYNINSDNMIYAFVATGHKAAGLNTTPNFLVGSHSPAPFKGEDVTDYEFGVKSTFFDGHVRTQIGGYYSQYNNFQVNYLDSTLNLSLIQNASGTTVLEGLEGQLQAVFGPWTIDANGSVSHSRLGTWIARDPCTVYPPGTIGDPRCGGAPIDVAGNEQDYAPDATFNLGLQYRIDLPGDATLTPRIDYAYVASQWGTLFELPVDRLSARNLVNSQIVYRRGTWDVTAYATNLFNYQYNQLQSEGGARLPGAPRQYGLRISTSF